MNPELELRKLPSRDVPEHVTAQIRERAYAALREKARRGGPDGAPARFSSHRLFGETALLFAASLLYLLGTVRNTIYLFP